MKGKTEGVVATGLQRLKRLVVLGVPGAGKGTFTRLLRPQLMHCTTITAGDIIREEIKGNTPQGVRMKEIVDKGELVPDSMVTAMLMEYIKNAPGYVLDGFPRTRVQADHLQSTEFKPELALNFRIPDEVLVTKNTNRWNCVCCGQGYNTADIRGVFNGVRLNMPPLLPKVEGVCDKCGGALKRRTDDTEKVIQNRINVYHESSQPLLDLYEQEGILVNWDVRNGVEDAPELEQQLSQWCDELIP